MNVHFIFELLCSGQEINLQLAEQLAASQGWDMLSLLRAGGYAQMGLDRLDKFLTQELDCYGLGLEYLPALLPAQISRLDCSRNRLRKLPEVLPALLEELDCSENQLTALPLHLPSPLHSIDCHSNRIKNLIVSSLQHLECFRCCDNPIDNELELQTRFKLSYSSWWFMK